MEFTILFCYHFICQDDVRTVIFQVLDHIVKDIAMASIANVASLFKTSSDSSNQIFTPREIDEYNRFVGWVGS